MTPEEEFILFREYLRRREKAFRLVVGLRPPRNSRGREECPNCRNLLYWIRCHHGYYWINCLTPYCVSIDARIDQVLIN